MARLQKEITSLEFEKTRADNDNELATRVVRLRYEDAVLIRRPYVLFHGSLFGKLERTIKRY